MQLGTGGLDVFYVDESADDDTYAMVAIAIPLLRDKGGKWEIVWDQYFEAARKFRRDLKQVHGVPTKKELHAVKLASGRGHYRHGKQQFLPRAAAEVYKWALAHLGFLPEASVITVVADRGAMLYGASQLEASLHALFQRMQRATSGGSRNAITFFDEGHGEYRTIYRRARVYLPTGQKFPPYDTVNIPMSSFIKDANFKDSKHSHFVQVADLIAYAALLLRRAETARLTAWQAAGDLGTAYDQIPVQVLNRRASAADARGIVRI